MIERTLSIRSASPADSEAISNIYLASRNRFLPFAPLAHSDENVRKWIANQLIPNSKVTVAIMNGKIMGMMALHHGELIGWIDQLYIHPDAVGLGLGSKLVNLAKETFESPIRLFCFEENQSARSFYERHGFIAIAFYDGSQNEEKCPDVLYEWKKGSS